MDGVADLSVDGSMFADDEESMNASSVMLDGDTVSSSMSASMMLDAEAMSPIASTMVPVPSLPATGGDGFMYTPQSHVKYSTFGTARSWVPTTPTTAPARLHFDDDFMTPTRAKTPSTKVKTVETDGRRLGQRSKQVTYGKATLGYLLCKKVAKDAPAEKLAELPRTPRESQKCSKRCWDAQVRDWRVKLHAYDPKNEEEWRQAYAEFARETLELAYALSKNATQFSQTQCMPPEDIMEEAKAAGTAAAKRAPVQRSLNGMMEEELEGSPLRIDPDFCEAEEEIHQESGKEGAII